jgi:hypothetical protein
LTGDKCRAKYVYLRVNKGAETKQQHHSQTLGNTTQHLDISMSSTPKAQKQTLQEGKRVIEMPIAATLTAAIMLLRNK